MNYKYYPYNDNVDKCWNEHMSSPDVYTISVTCIGFNCPALAPYILMFLYLDILFEYWIEHVTFGPLYVMFGFSTRIFYMGVPGFATDCPCGDWCRGLITCLLYVGPFFGNLVWNDSGFVILT